MSHILRSLLLLLPILGFGNDFYTIKGVVKDKETEEPIPFAHVAIGDVINISNVDGEFIISAPEYENEQTRLKVSYMGYDEYEEVIQDLSSFQTILLEPSLVELAEVTVMTGPSIMKDVFNRLHINYPMERQHMVGYYRESMGALEDTYYVAEGIMDIYTPSNIDKIEYPFVQPLRTRKKVFKESLAMDELLGGNASDMAHSSIWRASSFLSEKNRRNYDYYYDGATTLGDKDVFIVEFEPNGKKGNTKGKLYIEEESNAIVKIEYHPILKDNKAWESVSWTEEYESRHGIYELMRVSFNGMSTNNKFEYNALLVINESRTIDRLPDSLFMMSQYDTFFDHAQDDFTDSFWTGFNFMKLDSKVASMME